MKWLLTEDAPRLADLLREAGQEVVSEPSVWASSQFGPSFAHPRQYLLDQIAQQHAVDVAVLVDPLRNIPYPPEPTSGKLMEFGYFRLFSQRLAKARRAVVLFSRDDPEPWRKFSNKMFPDCVCRPEDAWVYLTPSDEIHGQAESRGRAVRWREDGGSTGRLIAAVEHARAGRTYSPKRDAPLFR